MSENVGDRSPFILLLKNPPKTQIRVKKLIWVSLVITDYQIGSSESI